MSLLLFKWLTLLWGSEQVSGSLHGPFKRMSGGLRQPSRVSPRDSLLLFTVRCYADFSFWHWCLGRGPSLLWGSTTAKVSLPIFICHTVWHKPILRLHPSYQSQRGYFVITVVTGGSQ